MGVRCGLGERKEEAFERYYFVRSALAEVLKSRVTYGIKSYFCAAIYVVGKYFETYIIKTVKNV